MTHTATPNRRNAIRRAAAAVVRLCGQPPAPQAAHAAIHEATRQNSHIVNDVEGHCDRQAWAAVFALEDLAGQLVDHTCDGDNDSTALQALAGEIDPLDIACEECGAESGEECRPLCTAAWQHRHQFPALTHPATGISAAATAGEVLR